MKTGLVARVTKYNKAISEPQRMKMIKILGSNAEDTVSVSNVAAILGISQPAATKHLKILYDAGIIERKRIGTSVYYSLNNKTIEDYRKLMDYAFIKAFTPCPYEFKCEECPHAETCM